MCFHQLKENHSKFIFKSILFAYIYFSLIFKNLKKYNLPVNIFYLILRKKYDLFLKQRQKKVRVEFPPCARLHLLGL